MESSTRSFVRSAENPVPEITDIAGTSSSGSIKKKQQATKVHKPTKKIPKKSSKKGKKFISEANGKIAKASA